MVPALRWCKRSMARGGQLASECGVLPMDGASAREPSRSEQSGGQQSAYRQAAEMQSALSPLRRSAWARPLAHVGLDLTGPSAETHHARTHMNGRRSPRRHALPPPRSLACASPPPTTTSLLSNLS